MTTVGEIYRLMDEIAPFAWAESWDNSGLLVGSAGCKVDTALLALDVTGPVIEQAVACGAQLIITHHPVIFHKLGKLSAESIVYRLAQHNLSVISAHTNLDVAPGGVNDQLAARLGLTDCRPLQVLQQQKGYQIAVFLPPEALQRVRQAMYQAGAGQLGCYDRCSFVASGTGSFRPLAGANPATGQIGREYTGEELRLEMVCTADRLEDVLRAMRSAHPYEMPAYHLSENAAIRQPVALGVVGQLPEPMECTAFARMVKQALGCGGLKYLPVQKPIFTVGVCGGAGSDLVEQATALGCDALVTADTKYDRLLAAAQLGCMLVDAGHYNTEVVVLPALAQRLAKAMPQVRFLLATAQGDPCCYL